MEGSFLKKRKHIRKNGELSRFEYFCCSLFAIFSVFVILVALYFAKNHYHFGKPLTGRDFFGLSITCLVPFFLLFVNLIRIGKKFAAFLDKAMSKHRGY